MQYGQERNPSHAQFVGGPALELPFLSKGGGSLNLSATSPLEVSMGRGGETTTVLERHQRLKAQPPRRRKM